MFRNAIKIFRIFGIDVDIDISWFVVFFLFSFTLSEHYFPEVLPGVDLTTYWTLGITVTILIFVSVLIHELAHSLMAIKEGIPINKITLFIFGGVAQMKKEPEEPSSELKIAIIGPLSSITLGVIFGILYLVLPEGQAVTAGVEFLSRINFVVGTINMIPAFPLDGGRVLRGLLWLWKKNLLLATRIAVTAGSVFAFFAMGFGFIILFTLGSIWGLWYIFIGWLLYQAGQSSYSQVALKESLSGIKVEEVMSREVQTIEAGFSISYLIDKFYEYRYGAFPVVEKDSLRGLVSINHAKEVSREKWEEVKVEDIMTPMEDCIVTSPEEEAVDVMIKMAGEGAGRALVVKDDKLMGILSNTDMMRVIKLRTLFGSD
ncbi:MAG: CBS domain-containing protein [Candidatus Syntrophonatronum acetioxidans]|uniref:Zinc metalloprotease n=1 Tax=Candidatus Syntrophonatronum acetioxidans TaxID=1795816 RepID=A0A424YH33_9FIRM|nr:MAG: CBS domain-containing protein [Candidatus Syntrophonatronum acetioxidans]